MTLKVPSILELVKKNPSATFNSLPLLLDIKSYDFETEIANLDWS